MFCREYSLGFNQAVLGLLVYVPEGCIFHDLLFYMYMYVCVCVCVDLSDDGFECGEEESLPKTAFQSKRFEVVLF